MPPIVRENFACDSIIAKKRKQDLDQVFFDKLPNEIVLKFLECLPSVDRYKFRLLSRRFYRLIKANHHLQRMDIPSLIIAKDGIHVETQEGLNITFQNLNWLKRKLRNVDIAKLVKWSGAHDGFRKVKFLTRQLMNILEDNTREISIHRFECHLIEDQVNMRISQLLRLVNPRELLLRHDRPHLDEVLEIPPRCERLYLETDWSYWQGHDLTAATELKWVMLDGYFFCFAPHSSGHFNQDLLRRLKARRHQYSRCLNIAAEFYDSFLEIGFKVQQVGAAFEIIRDNEEFCDNNVLLCDTHGEEM